MCYVYVVKNRGYYNVLFISHVVTADFTADNDAGNYHIAMHCNSCMRHKKV